jgi:hypothetical protein
MSASCHGAGRPSRAWIHADRADSAATRSRAPRRVSNPAVSSANRNPRLWMPEDRSRPGAPGRAVERTALDASRERGYGCRSGDPRRARPFPRSSRPGPCRSTTSSRPADRCVARTGRPPAPRRHRTPPRGTRVAHPPTAPAWPPRGTTGSAADRWSGPCSHRRPVRRRRR